MRFNPDYQLKSDLFLGLVCCPWLSQAHKKKHLVQNNKNPFGKGAILHNKSTNAIIKTHSRSTDDAHCQGHIFYYNADVTVNEIKQNYTDLRIIP